VYNITKKCNFKFTIFLLLSSTQVHVPLENNVTFYYIGQCMFYRAMKAYWPRTSSSHNILFFWSIKANIDLIKRLKLYNSIIALFNLHLYCCCTPSRSTFTCVLVYKRKTLNLRLYFFVILYTYIYICNGYNRITSYW
jgi:hypothetical protein